MQRYAWGSVRKVQRLTDDPQFCPDPQMLIKNLEHERGTRAVKIRVCSWSCLSDTYVIGKGALMPRPEGMKPKSSYDVNVWQIPCTRLPGAFLSVRCA